MLESGYAAPELASRAQLLVRAVVRECCADILVRGYNEGEKPSSPEDFVRVLRAKFGID